MSGSAVAERYAKALSQVVDNPEELDRAVESLYAFQEAVEEDERLAQVLANPAIPKAAREKVLNTLLERLECPAPVAQLVRVLLRRGRIGVLADVSRQFAEKADRRLNRSRAHITTAEPLLEDQETRIRECLERYSGKTVTLDKAIDPYLMGGVVAEIDGKVLDGSLRTRLEIMKDALMGQEL